MLSNTVGIRRRVLATYRPCLRPGRAGGGPGPTLGHLVLASEVAETESAAGLSAAGECQESEAAACHAAGFAERRGPPARAVVGLLTEVAYRIAAGRRRLDGFPSVDGNLVSRFYEMTKARVDIPVQALQTCRLVSLSSRGDGVLSLER